MWVKKQTGTIMVAEIVGTLAAIAVLMHIATWYNGSKEIQAQAKEGFDFATEVATNVIDYYGDNSDFPTGTGYDYGTDPGEYTASVVYNAPVSGLTHGYVIATFRSGPSGLNKVLQGKWIIKLFSVSGAHLVSNCYTNINASLLSGTTLTAGEDSTIVKNSCEIADSIAAVVNI